MLPGTGESGKWEMTVNGHRISFEGDESILGLVWWWYNFVDIKTTELGTLLQWMLYVSYISIKYSKYYILTYIILWEISIFSR